MGYKTIVVHLDNDSRCAERVDIASRLAVDGGAHLVGLYATELLELRVPFAGIPGPEVIAASYARYRAWQREVTDLFHERTARGGPDGAEMRTVQGDPVEALELHARYADLLVVGQIDPDVDGDLPSARLDIPDQAVLRAAAPVLIVPCAGTYPRFGEHILVAWDASRQAARSVRAALPFLKKAGRVTVLVVNPAEPHGEVPGADVALYLARHGVRVEAKADHVREIDVGSWLVSRASDLGADMIVMGGYSHTLMRERLFGGVTRSLLGQMTVPVLVEH